MEINSSFYRPHRRETYARWAASVPPGFRFSIKCPREITHDRELRRVDAPLERFLNEIAGLGRTRGPILVQLPPSLAFSRLTALKFLSVLRALDRGPVVLEPRHASWFADSVDELLRRFHISRAAADPIRCAGAGCPSGWNATTYFRLHGSPRTYWTRYHRDYIAALAHAICELPSRTRVWCIFDNTAAGAAIENARELAHALQPASA